MIRRAIVAVLLGACACARPAPLPPPAAPPAAAPPVAWQTSLDRDHPLVGRIWDVKRARFVTERELDGALQGYVLLGEKHDNPDHHALQARVIDAMLAAHRRPVVAFEMLDLDAQAAIDAARAASPSDPDAIARAVDWAHTGWPDFAMYRPVVQAALATSMPLVATGLPRAKLRAVMKSGPEASELPAPAPIDADATASLREELVDDHCGKLPAAMVDAMVSVQRTRDATMARAMTDAIRRSGATDAVLVAGNGHTRTDRGVPHDLAADDPARPVVSVAFVEVERDLVEPAAYASHWKARALPFDYVWFTPRANDDDPCAGMR